MANNLNFEDGIDLLEIIKVLIESKKFIMSTILIFTIASIIYSLSLKPLFISSAQLEIGYVKMENGDKKLIESTSDLISQLKVQLLKNPVDKSIQNLIMKSFEGKVINLETSSSSAENNENLLTEIINNINEYLEKKIIDQRNNLISYDIENAMAEISHFKLKLSDQSQSEYLNIISTLKKEDQKIEHLRLLYRNSSYEDKVFALNQKLSNLNQEYEKFSSSVESPSQIIRNIETKIKKPKIALIILLGLIFGLCTGIFLVFIRNVVKSFKESQT